SLTGSGTFTGQTDNFSCATRDLTDPIYANSCSKTLWYKFSTSVTGHLRYHISKNGVWNFGNDNIQLFRQILPGDSTSTGLLIKNTSNTGVQDNGMNWSQACISPGTYYLILPGCNSTNEYVYPEIKVIEEGGDFCGTAVPAVINGPGTAMASAIVDCHTIGTD